jgi:hypothetical protein
MIGKLIAGEPLPDFQLALTWDDGTRRLLYLNAMIESRSVLAPLRDPAEFARARLSEDGWSLQWPCGIDFGAAQLRAWTDAPVSETVSA